MAELSSVHSLQDADAVLGELRTVQRELDQKQANLEDELVRLRASAAPDLEKLQTRRQLLAAALEAFAVRHKDELFADRAKRILIFGAFGFRRSTRIEAGNDTLALLDLHERGGEAIRVKRSVDLTALHKWDEANLATVDARRVQHEEFFWDVP